MLAIKIIITAFRTKSNLEHVNFSKILISFPVAILEIWLAFIFTTIIIINILYELLMSIAVNRCSL